MEQRELLTAKPPPFEIFTNLAAKFQKHYEAPTQGNYLEKIDYPPEGIIAAISTAEEQEKQFLK